MQRGILDPFRSNSCKVTKKDYELFCNLFEKYRHEDKHNGINQHQCPVCKKIFNTKGLCSRHIKSVHEKEKQYSCEHCEFKTFHAYSLTAHIQQVHEKYKPNKCDFCDEAFFYKRDLEKHYTKIHQATTIVTYAMIDN